MFLTVSSLFCTDYAPIFKIKVPWTIRFKDLSCQSHTLVQFLKTPQFHCVVGFRPIQRREGQGERVKAKGLTSHVTKIVSRESSKISPACVIRLGPNRVRLSA